MPKTKKKVTDFGDFQDIGFPDGMAEESLVLMFIHTLMCPDPDCSTNRLMAILLEVYDVTDEQLEQWSAKTKVMTERFLGEPIERAFVNHLMEGVISDMMEDGYSVTV